MTRALYCVALFSLMSGCATPRTPAPITKAPEPVVNDVVDPQRELHRALDEFLTLVEAGRFDALHALLSKSLRDRYTPALLQRDFGTEPWAAERVARIKAKASQSFTLQGDRAALEWAPGRSIQLIRESTSWKVAALE